MNKDIDELITIIKGGKEYFMPCYRLDEINCDKIISALEELKQLREENESLKKDIEAYDNLIESEIGFGEGEQ